MNSKERQKSIFEYDDYRLLLHDLYNYNKANNKAFSHRYFARIAGFAAPNFLKLVMDGKSNLSEKSIEKFIKGFKLNQEEGRFFYHLVLFNQSTTSDERQNHAQELLRFRAYKKLHPLSEAQYNFYSKWYFVPVREIVRMRGFREDPNWIASVLKGDVTPEQVQRALDDLQTLNLLARDSEGRLVQTTESLATSDEVVSSSIAQWHKEMMKRASESIDSVKRDQRDISAVTVSLSKINIEKLKDLVSVFRKDLLSVMSEDNGCEVVYQLNIQLFPLAEDKGGGPV